MDSYVVYCEAALSRTLPLLIIPVAHVSELSTKPFKWIRYAAAALLGSGGVLTRYNENEDQDDLTLNLEEVAPIQRKLHFVPDQPIKFIDPDGLDHLKSSQLTTESRTGFRDALLMRDGGSVATGATLTSEGCHLIPHSKGSEVRL